MARSPRNAPGGVVYCALTRAVELLPLFREEGNFAMDDGAKAGGRRAWITLVHRSGWIRVPSWGENEETVAFIATVDYASMRSKRQDRRANSTIGVRVV